jgi:hypothetical protein
MCRSERSASRRSVHTVEVIDTTTPIRSARSRIGSDTYDVFG